MLFSEFQVTYPINRAWAFLDTAQNEVYTQNCLITFYLFYPATKVQSLLSVSLNILRLCNHVVHFKFATYEFLIFSATWVILLSEINKLIAVNF